MYKPHRAAFELLQDRADEYGYDITYKVVNTANYGVPQMRERFICVGIKRGEGEKFVFPEETHYDPEKVPEEKRGNKNHGLLAAMLLETWIMIFRKTQRCRRDQNIRIY